MQLPVKVGVDYNFFNTNAEQKPFFFHLTKKAKIVKWWMLFNHKQRYQNVDFKSNNNYLIKQKVQSIL